MKLPLILAAAFLLVFSSAARCADADTKTLRVFIFAGQSNMEGAHGNAKKIGRFPPFAGLDVPQEKVLFSYNIGREQEKTSNGWVALQPVGTLVGPVDAQKHRHPTDERHTGDKALLIRVIRGLLSGIVV